MRMINEQCMLRNVFYVPNFGVNLLSEKKHCVSEFRKNFDENKLYLHNQAGIQVFKASNQKEFYIVNKIAFELNEHALIASTILEIIAMPALIKSMKNEMIDADHFFFRIILIYRIEHQN